MTRSDWLWLAACTLSGLALGLSIVRVVCVVREDIQARAECRQDCEGHWYAVSDGVCNCEGVY